MAPKLKIPVKVALDYCATLTLGPAYISEIPVAQTQKA
uniref:Uncharacterized protein n=1 Tax=Anguilla anguilla TaxID=7936 RepID=A0A0E9W386_ANGAN